MNKRIILTSLLVAFVFSSFIIYYSFAQTTNLPICVAPQQYLYWQSGQHAAGYVPFASTSINFLMRSPIYVSSAGNVGIGTANPQYKLQVVSGSGRWTAINADGSIVVNRDGAPPYILFQGSGGGVSYIYNPSEGTTGRAMAFYTQADGQNYSEKVRITGAGNVGIGTTTPQAKLHVEGNTIISNRGSDPSLIFYGRSTDNASAIRFRVATDNYDRSTILNLNSNLIFYTGGSSTAHATEKMRITSSGNVGIGTNNPQAKLHVVGDILSSNKVTANQFCIGTNCINQWPSQVAQYWTLSGNNLYTSSINWNVGIGTNNPPVYKLYIYNTNPNLYGSLGATTIVDSPAFVYGIVGSSHNTNVNGPAIGVYGWASSSNASYGVYGVGYGPSGTGVRAYGEKYNIFAGNPNAFNIFYGNVGIGTTIPQAKLDVVGEIKTTGLSVGGYSGTVKTSTGLGVYGHSEFQNNLVIGGNVGIGTTNPRAKLEVAGAIRLTPTSQPSNATTGMMYFDQSSGVFKCFQKDERGNYGWVDCGGAPRGPSEGLIIPVVIKDSAGNVVLEINQE